MEQAASTVNPMSLPLPVEILLTVVLVAVISVAVIGNSMVCLAISRSRSLRAQVSNVFIINLAITDLGCASLVMPFSVVSVWFDHWIFGSFLCDTACFFNYCFIIASMLSLALISVDRHIYVVYPFRYTMIMTHRRAIALVFCTWIVGFIFAAAPPIMRWVIFDNAEVICAINWESNHSQILAYTISAFVICFMSPIVVMVYCYIGIYKVANRHAKRIAPPQVVGRICSGEGSRDAEASSYSQPDLSQTCNGHPTLVTSQNQPTALRGKKSKPKTPGYYSTKAIRSILVMILAYTICNTPFSLTKLIKVIKINNEAVPFYVNTAAAWFGFINPCCNPIIYSILREDFRAAFIKLLPQSVVKRLRKDTNSVRSQIVINSPKFTTRVRNNVTVNIINASPLKRTSLTITENPLNVENDYMAATAYVNTNNAVVTSGNEITHPNGDIVNNEERQSNERTTNHGLNSPVKVNGAPLAAVDAEQNSEDDVNGRPQSSPGADAIHYVSPSRRWSLSLSDIQSPEHDKQSLATTISI